MKFPTLNGRMAVNTGTPTANDQYSNGVRLVADASAVYATTDATGGAAGNGLLLNTTSGSMVTVDATAGLPANATWCNGMPVAANGAVCTSTDAPQSWSNGVPFAANGAVSV